MDEDAVGAVLLLPAVAAVDDPPVEDVTGAEDDEVADEP